MIIEALLAKMKKLCYESVFNGHEMWIVGIEGIFGYFLVNGRKKVQKFINKKLN